MELSKNERLSTNCEVEFNCEAFCKKTAALVQDSFEQFIEKSNWSSELIEWSRYAVCGGKFLRPAMFLWSYSQFCKTQEFSQDVLNVALAIELIHAFSLIQDDLPCMDNDELRRGKATLHIVAGEANALLCSDALFAASFQLLARLDNSHSAELIDCFVDCVGGSGLIEGQRRDLLNTDNVSLAELDETYCLKTAKLFSFCFLAPAILMGKGQIQALRKLGENLGVYFQITDDLLDALLSSGKDVNSDHKNNKETYLNVNQVELSDKMRELSQQILSGAEKIFGNSIILKWLSVITERNR